MAISHCFSGSTEVKKSFTVSIISAFYYVLSGLKNTFFQVLTLVT